MSPTLSFRRSESATTASDVPEVQPIVFVPDVFLRDLFDTSLLCMYADHVTRHV